MDYSWLFLPLILVSPPALLHPFPLCQMTPHCLFCGWQTVSIATHVELPSPCNECESRSLFVSVWTFEQIGCRNKWILTLKTSHEALNWFHFLCWLVPFSRLTHHGHILSLLSWSNTSELLSQTENFPFFSLSIVLPPSVVLVREQRWYFSNELVWNAHCFYFTKTYRCSIHRNNLIKVT